MRPNLLPLPLLLLAALSGCGDPAAPPSSPDAAIPGPDAAVVAACTRDPAAIAERRACLTHEHCPCGTRCELGECLAACTVDQNCPNGQRCDELGTCRDLADQTLALPPPPVPDLGKVIEPAELALHPGAVRPLWIAAPGSPLGALRVVAPPGLELDCAGDGVFAGQCRFDGVAAGARRALAVRVTSELAEGEVRVVRVYTHGGLRTVSVRRAEAAGLRALSLPGRYRGFAEAVELGVEGSGALSPAPRSLALPITARFFSADGVLELSDPLFVLHPSGTWAGRLASGQVAFPAYHLPLPAAVDGVDPEVLVEASTSTLTVAGTTEATLSFDLVLRYRGVLVPPKAPLVRYHLSLTREGELLESDVAPSVPADEVLAAGVERVFARSGWERALERITPTPTAAEYAAAYRGEAHDPRVCAAGDGEHAALAPTLLPELFRPYRRVDEASGRVIAAWESNQIVLGERNPLWRFLLDPLTPALLDLGNGAASGVYNARLAVTAAPAAGAGLLPTDLPCAISTPTPWTLRLQHGYGSAACDELLGGAERAAQTQPATIDRCASLAATFDCDVIDAPGAGAPLGPTLELDVVSAPPAGDNSASFVSGLFTTSSGLQSCGFTLVADSLIRLDVQKVCRLRQVPRTCAESTLCQTDPDPGASSAGLVGLEVPPGGDLACATGEGAARVELDGARPEDHAASLLSGCLADLARLAAPPVGASLPDLFDGSVCFGARPLAALLEALAIARGRALWGTGAAPDTADALGHRLLQRWFEVHAFLARESLQAERLAEIIRRVDPNDDAVPPPVDEVARGSIQGWSLLLAPQVAAPVDALPDEVLAAPDYRPRVTGAAVLPNPNHDQALGLPVTIAETAAAQLELAALRLERAQYQPDAAALPAAGAVLRAVIPARALGASLEARARAFAAATGARPTWATRAEATAGSFEAALLQVLEGADRVVRHKNPLSIEDSDLPLYFFGDEASASRRFSAISDFLLGTGPGTTVGWAPVAVRQAVDAMGAAREAWNQFKARQLQRVVAQGELAQRVQALAFEYGDKVGEYCSAPDSLGTADILDRWEEGHGRPFSANNCFIKLDAPGCRVDLGAYAKLLRGQDIAYQLCVAQELKQRSGVAIGFTDPAYQVAFENCADYGTVRYPERCPDGSETCWVCQYRRTEISIDARHAPAELDALHRVRAAPSLLAEARAACAVKVPNASLELPSFEQLQGETYDQGKCYRGTLGEQALTLRAAAKDIEIARSEMAEHEESYDIAMKSCFIEQLGNQAKEGAQAAHDETMTQLRAGKLVADIAATAAGGAKDCGAAIGADSKFGAGSAVACTAAAIETVAASVSTGLQFAMDQADQKHAATMLRIENDIRERTCFNDAQQNLVGTRTAALRVQRAMQDLQLAIYQFNEMRIAADTYFADGTAALAVLREKTVVPTTHDFWIDEAVRTFQRKMSFARRITYLTVRAVEYEYQQSLAAGAAVLAAEVPDDLDAVLQQLLAEAGTRSIGGHRPADLEVVVSLRDELLSLHNQNNIHPASRRLTSAQRLRLLLVDPRFAVRDAQGAYLGHRLPFALTPAALPAGDCAERLWSMSANVLGGPGVLSGAAPSVRLEIRKKNTFFSRWCSGAGRGAPLQAASVRPSKNLLRGGDLAAPGLGLERQTQDYTAARVTAWSGVPAADFYGDGYRNGDTSELAARGLFGDYELFIPAASISDGVTPGLVLSQIDDVLLRFDYVSVAAP